MAQTLEFQLGVSQVMAYGLDTDTAYRVVLIQRKNGKILMKDLDTDQVFGCQFADVAEAQTFANESLGPVEKLHARRRLEELFLRETHLEALLLDATETAAAEPTEKNVYYMSCLCGKVADIRTEAQAMRARMAV